ncbi:BANK1 protein, partial [Turnix velox]|nr:BANK1 protein [Turnix velox]
EGDNEEENPYTLSQLDESLYNLILSEESRTKSRSFIVNRPPAPAPRPTCSSVQEENIPYIVQVFQQKATEVPSDRTYCHARKPAHSGHPEPVRGSSMKHSICAHQEEVIHLQEQVKKGTTSVDDVLDRFKQGQNENQRLQPAQQ